jgi:hypothetical protein
LVHTYGGFSEWSSVPSKFSHLLFYKGIELFYLKPISIQLLLFKILSKFLEDICFSKRLERQLPQLKGSSTRNFQTRRIGLLKVYMNSSTRPLIKSRLPLSQNWRSNFQLLIQGTPSILGEGQDSLWEQWWFPRDATRKIMDARYFCHESQYEGEVVA